MPGDLDLSNLGRIPGLSEKEAAARLNREGFNEIPSAKKRSIFNIALNVLKEPMLLLLIASGIIYLVVGDIQEALMLLAFVFVIIGITFYQERRTERTLEALRDLSSPRALVIRGGVERRIAGREVARGDLIILAEGDRVPADSVVLSANNLTIDESLLTGESAPVFKGEADDSVSEMKSPGGENSPFIYSGTLVVSGLAAARVLGTGLNTEFGKIGKSLSAIETEQTGLQKETRRIVRSIAAIGLSICAAMAVIYGLTTHRWVDGFLAAITLAMAILPEEFPVVLTVFLALGAWRISKSNVLTRKTFAIETLGATTVLCVDKTGTLTMNRMSVKKLFSGGDYFNVDTKAPPEKFHQLIEYGLLASQSNPFDPMEKAMATLGEQKKELLEHIHSDWSLQREYPLSKNLLAISRVWRSPDRTNYVVAVKGAPEAIMDLCHLDTATVERLNSTVELMAGEGLRVIGVARAQFSASGLPVNQHDFDFRFIGFVGFADPVRQTVAPAIKECYQAGIRTVMITGDYPVTAQNIARQIGLQNPDAVITGVEMNNLNDDELAEKAKNVNIFARVVPEQKLRIVSVFRKNGEIVAMTGDGVNDAPALKAADIGIAMGGRGTDVAREAGALVLLDDDFSSIVKAVRLGRRIFDNLRKAMAYILAVHVPIAGLSLIPVLLKWPLMLKPVHVVFLELIIDPACSIIFEAESEEPNIMERPPRNPKERLFNRRTVLLSLLQGVIILVVTILLYGWVLNNGRGELEARALAFTTLVLANLGLILTNRYWSMTIISSIRRKNTSLGIIVGATLVFLGLVLYVPPIRSVFHFDLLHANDILLCFAAAALSISWFEGVKYFTRARQIANGIKGH